MSKASLDQMDAEEEVDDLEADSGNRRRFPSPFDLLGPRRRRTTASKPAGRRRFPVTTRPPLHP